VKNGTVRYRESTVLDSAQCYCVQLHYAIDSPTGCNILPGELPPTSSSSRLTFKARSLKNSSLMRFALFYDLFGAHICVDSKTM